MLPELELLQEKLGKLLKQYSALQVENSRLLRRSGEQEDLILTQKETIKALEKELQVHALAETDISGAGIGKGDLKKYLGEVISEIEKSLAALK